MGTKTIQDKIKDVADWTFRCFVIYLVVAFFLKSKYPIFNYDFCLECAYEVIKDALTLTAAFLAPVAAFVLFTDWRGQHVEVENEKISKEIVLGILPIIEKSTSDFFQFQDDPEGMFKFREHYFNNLYELRNKVSQISSINSRSLEFIVNGEELAKRLLEGFNLMDAYLNANSNANWANEFSVSNENQTKDLSDKFDQALNSLIAKNEEIRLLIKKFNVLNIAYN